ncbi:MAG: hypothetical protein CL484_04780 [Acidobacteria bacterium]|nr:hypothetical protein [Acidobacteriota bacterium]
MLLTTGSRVSVILLVIVVAAGCQGGGLGLFGPSTSVDGTWTGTFAFGTTTADVTATLSEGSGGEDTVAGTFTAVRSTSDDSGLPNPNTTDGGSITGAVGKGIGLPTVTLTFESTKHCHWTLTAVLDDKTMTGTWSTASGCDVAFSGGTTLSRS